MCLAAALLTVGAARAQTAEERATLAGIGTVNTHAQASTRLPNTVADVTVGIEVTGKDSDTAAQQVSERSGALIAYLRRIGADRLLTGEVGFEPQNHTAKTGVETIVGYTATTTVSFRTTPDKLGATISGALANGANKVDSTNLHPREMEINVARRSLADEATKQAIAEAEAIAHAAGERILAVKEITVGQTDVPPRPFAMRAMMMGKVNAAPAPIAIAAGDAELSVMVNVTMSISR